MASTSSGNAAAAAVTGLGSASRARFAGSVALLVYVVIFPGFFVYHVSVASGLLAPVLRGYSAAAALLSMPALAFAYLVGARLVGALDALFFGFLAFVVAVTLAGYARAADSGIVVSYLAVVPQWLALYLTARLLDVDALHARTAFRVSFLAMVVLVAVNATQGSFLLAALQFAIADRENLATYQDFALLLLGAMTLAAAGFNTVGWRVATYLGALVALFLTGARSEFLALFVVAFTIELIRARRRWLVVTLGAMAIAAIAMLVQSLLYLFPENRVADLVVNRAEGSLSQRATLLNAALQTISEHPLAGDFASYLPGEYSHNLLSVWVDFGVVGIFWLLLLLVWLAFDLVARQRTQGSQVGYLSAVSLLTAAVTLLMTAKSFTYPLLPFAIGLCANVQGRRSLRWLRSRRGGTVRVLSMTSGSGE